MTTLTTTDPTTDPWYTPPVPMAELIERYSPAHGYATIAIPPADIRFGDVTDHTDGLLIVTEITMRRSSWTIRGYNPALPYRVPNPDRNGWPTRVERPFLARDLTYQPRIRVRRPAGAWARLAGHTKTVTTHNPTTRGMYTIADGWDAACSCGWKGPKPYPGQGSAGQAILTHRAEVLTDLTDRRLGNLASIQRLEAGLGDVLPWHWDHGAHVQLRGLTTAQALERLTPWATALGADIEHMGANAYGLRGEHFLWIQSPPDSNDPRLDIRAYPNDGQDSRP